MRFHAVVAESYQDVVDAYVYNPTASYNRKTCDVTIGDDVYVLVNKDNIEFMHGYEFSTIVVLDSGRHIMRHPLFNTRLKSRLKVKN